MLFDVSPFIFLLYIYFFFSGSTCGTPQINSLVEATPIRDVYQIGDAVTLSCPAGSVLDSQVSEIRCSSSLQWSPSPAHIQCKTGINPYLQNLYNHIFKATLINFIVPY